MTGADRITFQNPIYKLSVIYDRYEIKGASAGHTYRGLSRSYIQGPQQVMHTGASAGLTGVRREIVRLSSDQPTYFSSSTIKHVSNF